jgi:hypothetical protein
MQKFVQLFESCFREVKSRGWVTLNCPAEFIQAQVPLGSRTMVSRSQPYISRRKSIVPTKTRADLRSEKVYIFLHVDSVASWHIWKSLSLIETALRMPEIT